MEFSVISTELNTSDIKPEKSLRTYIDLLKQDIKSLFSPSQFVESSCPACETRNTQNKFEKLGFAFTTCSNCLTVYVAKRPKQVDLDQFYKTSAARKYWIENIWKTSESARLNKIITPLMDWVRNFILTEFQNEKLKVAEFYAHNTGLHQAWQGQKEEFFLVAATIPEFANGLPLETNKTFHAVCLMEALDRVENPKVVLEAASQRLVKGGYVFVTGILSTGLDTLVLRQHSEAILPPDRLNCFSHEGIEKLVKHVGFEVVEFSTPGLLDLENIRHAAIHDKDLSYPFLNYILNVRKDENLNSNFQTFLQQNRLSSRARLVLRKK